MGIRRRIWWLSLCVSLHAGVGAQEIAAPRKPDVPYVATPSEVVATMLKLAKVRKNDVVYDLGCGDGRIVITAARKFGARGVGVDLDPQRIAESNENARQAKVTRRVEFLQQDLFETRLSEATVVTLYLLPKVNLRLRPKLFAELKPRSRIVSHDFDMGDWQPETTVEVKGPYRTHRLFYWVMPATPDSSGRRAQRDERGTSPALRTERAGGQPSVISSTDKKGDAAAKVNPEDGAEMVWIPAGDSLMGKDERDLDAEIARYGWDKDWKDWILDETPKHRAEVDGFWMYKCEVTAAQYRKFCEATGHAAPWDPLWGKQPDDHPVVNVSWEDAKAYAEWAGCQLPTEDQWEYAACAGRERAFPWGNEWDRRKCNSASHHAGKDLTSSKLWESWWKMEDLKKPRTTSVGSFPQGASPFGCEDMAGNVWEWCQSWYDKYPGSAAKSDDFGQEYRVIRGGAWLTVPYYVRCSKRHYLAASYRISYVGFRCCKTP